MGKGGSEKGESKRKDGRKRMRERKSEGFRKREKDTKIDTNL